MISALDSTIMAGVQKLYEAFPYPAYPLLAKPRWQEGYLVPAEFSKTLVQDLRGQNIHDPKPAASSTPLTLGRRSRVQVLVAGSGEMLPYVMRRWQVHNESMLCVDISRRSLQRARLRLLGHMLSPLQTRRSKGHWEFVHGGLEDYLAYAGQLGMTYEHIDAYGVLHHLASPSQTIAAMANVCTSTSTIRVMVYNSPSRSWIRHFQRAFRTLGLDPYSKSDRKLARQLLRMCGEHAPLLASRLQAMGPTIKRDAGLADTFFHAREINWAPSKWIETFSSAGLEATGLFDRYGEWDDCANPLWVMPSPEEMDIRARDRRFENNLELFLCGSSEFQATKAHSGSHQSRKEKSKEETRVRKKGVQNSFGIFRRMSPPYLWSSYLETQQIPGQTLRKLWLAHLQHRRGHRSNIDSNIDHLVRQLPQEAAQRLARLGAIFPGQISDAKLRDVLQQPMVDRMECPETSGGLLSPLGGTQVEQLVCSELKKRSRPDDRLNADRLHRKLRHILSRLEAGAGIVAG